MKHISFRLDVFFLASIYAGILFGLFMEALNTPFLNIVKFDMCSAVVLGIVGILWRRWYRRKSGAVRDSSMRAHVRSEEIRQDWKENR